MIRQCHFLREKRLSSFPARCFGKAKLNHDPEILLIRHAQSEFNQACKNKAKQLGIEDLSFFDQDKNDEFAFKAAFNPEYMDCSITAQGRQQCMDAAEQLRDVEVDLILVSPKRRTLETCSIVFGGRGIPVRVEPLLSEACRYACDAVRPHEYQDKIRQFPQFDFPHDLSGQYVYNISESQISAYQKYCGERGIREQGDRDKVLMRMMREQQVYETDSELRQRAWRIKQMLKEISQKHGYKRICLVSHWYVITYLCSRAFSESGENLDYDEVANCSPIRRQLSKLLEVE